MTKIVNLPAKINENRFLNREEFESIKKRFNALPDGIYKSAGNMIFLVENGISEEICESNFPKFIDVVLHLKEDLRKLIVHVEQADIENDKLNQRIEEIKANNEA